MHSPETEAQITIEFYGTARHRMGISTLTIDWPSHGNCLQQLWSKLAARFPELCGPPTEFGQREFLVNLDGERFVTDPDTPIHAGQNVLILSPDVGG